MLEPMSKPGAAQECEVAIIGGGPAGLMAAQV
jgi:cation diffusion facilitator CzcD-associated flavoprotein CzcO